MFVLKSYCPFAYSYWAIFNQIFSDIGKNSVKDFLTLGSILSNIFLHWEIFCQRYSNTGQYSVKDFLTFDNILSTIFCHWAIFCQRYSNARQYSIKNVLLSVNILAPVFFIALLHPRYSVSTRSIRCVTFITSRYILLQVLKFSISDIIYI